MTSKRMSAVDDDAPALAGAIVYHAGQVCESADHLWRVLGEVSIPVDGLTDGRQQHKVANGTEPMARVYLYQEIYDLAQSKVADRLENRPSLLILKAKDTCTLSRLCPYGEPGECLR